jgi:hypothetical protein
MSTTHVTVLERIGSLYKMLFEHSGYGEMSVEIRFLRKHEKEVLIKCGKQYRYIVPCNCPANEDCSCCESGNDTGRENKHHNRKPPAEIKAASHPQSGNVNRPLQEDNGQSPGE